MADQVGHGQRRILDGVRVVDIADEAAVFATRILADLGADVVRVEPPGGGRIRNLAPFLDDVEGVERSFHHLHLNANKRSVTGDPDVVRRLIAVSHVLVETGNAPAYEELAALNPSLVHVSVTPYGLGVDRVGTDVTLSAAGGLLYVCGPADGTPTQPGADQSWKMAGLVAAAGALAALFGGEGAHLDISVQDCVAATVLQTSNPNQHAWLGRVPKRPGLTAVYRTADGKYVTSYPSRNRVGTLVEWARSLGIEPDGTEEEIGAAPDLGVRTMGLFRAIAGRVTQADWMREVVERDIWSLPVNTLPDMRTCDHLVATGQFVEIKHEPLGVTLEAPRSAVDACGPSLPIGRAPLLGEHTADVLANLPPLPQRRTPPSPTPSKRPLEGVRILDFCWVLAGPLGTKVLANLGAEVIRVEASPDRWFPDFFPRGHERRLDLGSFHNNVNTAKRSVTIDPRHERGRELLLQLAERCDVVTDNFRPGALAEMGFGYDVLRARNPGIVVAHLPGCGSCGPWSTRPTLGNMVVAASGISALTGFPGRSPRGMGVAYPDFSSPYVMTSCVVAALHERRRTGVGRELDISQLSATISLIGTEWMQYAASGVEPQPRANRDPNFAPHGVYRCAGEDEWVAIAVDGDAQWSAMGISDDARFATHDSRKHHEDDLDRCVAAWTSSMSKWHVADLLQSRGIAAAAVANLPECLERDTRHYVRIRRPEAPDVEIVVHGEAIRFAGDGFPLVPAPAVGADNAYVCMELLGLDGEELAKLYDEGVFQL